jgi:hypothetical protein
MGRRCEDVREPSAFPLSAAALRSTPRSPSTFRTSLAKLPVVRGSRLQVQWLNTSTTQHQQHRPRMRWRSINCLHRIRAATRNLIRVPSSSIRVHQRRKRTLTSPPPSTRAAPARPTAFARWPAGHRAESSPLTRPLPPDPVAPAAVASSTAPATSARRSADHRR